MNNKDQKKLILQEIIIELRRRYDLINDMNRNANSRTITFIGAGFGLLIYLYSNQSIPKNNFFIPDEMYGKILYGLAIFLILGAMTKLFLSLGGLWWEFPCHEVKLKDIECKEKDLSFFQYIRDEYLRSTKLNLNTYENKHKILNTSC